MAVGKPPAHPELSDEQLVLRVQQQDVVAFTLLFDRYGPTVYSLAGHMLGASTQADDVVQEVFLRLWQAAAQFDPARGSFRSWLLAIARHAVIDELKRTQREHRLDAVLALEELFLTMPDGAPPVDEQAWNHAREEEMARALGELPAEQRRAILLAYFGGLSQSDIAEQTGWPLGTVKKRVRLALQKLRHRLVHWNERS